MDLHGAYQTLAALKEPAALVEGQYGPLNDEQRSYAEMIYEGCAKAQQWIEDWIKLEDQAATPESLTLHAHKINSGLTMMLGYASLMLTGVGGPVPPAVETALNAIMAAGEQIHDAVQQGFDRRLDELSAG